MSPGEGLRTRAGEVATCFANLTPLALQSPHHCQVFIEQVSFGIDTISILNLDNKISKYEFTPKVLATSIAFYKTPFLCFIDISKYSQLKIFWLFDTLLAVLSMCDVQQFYDDDIVCKLCLKISVALCSTFYPANFLSSHPWDQIGYIQPLHVV